MTRVCGFDIGKRYRCGQTRIWVLEDLGQGRLLIDVEQGAIYIGRTPFPAPRTMPWTPGYEERDRWVEVGQCD